MPTDTRDGWGRPFTCASCGNSDRWLTIGTTINLCEKCIGEFAASLPINNSAHTLRLVASRLMYELEAIVHESRAKDGMHVPFHGPLARAIPFPSLVTRFEYWSTAIRAALQRTDE